jgi:hypothetical protein
MMFEERSKFMAPIRAENSQSWLLCWLLFAVISPAPLRSIEDFRGEHRLSGVFSLYVTAKTATAQKADPRAAGVFSTKQYQIQLLAHQAI